MKKGLFTITMLVASVALCGINIACANDTASVQNQAKNSTQSSLSNLLLQQTTDKKTVVQSVKAEAKSAVKSEAKVVAEVKKVDVHHNAENVSKVTEQTTNLVASKKQDVIELQLEMKKNTKYKIFQMNNPSRLVIDVADDSIKIDYDAKSLQDTVIKSIRTAYHEGNKYRVVFDLNNAVEFSTQEKEVSSADQDKFNLIIDLKPKQ